jgi:hypothetical protein
LPAALAEQPRLNVMKALEAGPCREDAPPEEPCVQRREWLRDVDALCASIRQGLAPLMAAKLATVVSKEFAINDAA